MKTWSGLVGVAMVALVSAGCSDVPTSPSTAGTGQQTGTMGDTVSVAPGSGENFGQERYRALLSGGEMAPSVNTQASGTVSFWVSDDGDSIAYSVTSAYLVGASSVTIREGTRGESGPVVATLWSGRVDREYNGLLIQAVLSSRGLSGSLQGRSIADLLSLMNTGRAYVEVATLAHPTGEIRGQVAAVASQTQ